MAERNASVPTERQMRYRIGVNLGDVIHDEQRVYGDGVNIAARLESIAEPGGVCISGEAFAQVQRKLQFRFVDIGEHQLKNITDPVRVYRIDTAQQFRGAAQTRPVLALPDKPSIAVLPFTNLSGDPKEDYFSDGITEDIITELSRFSELFVIARNSSFTYKGKAVDIRQVGRELGVRYVLEGSIRRAGDRVRITGQLIDATTGVHRWAERYDRKLEDVFAAQDEVARTIVAILMAHVNRAEGERVLLKPPTSWQAHDYYLRASATFASFWSSLQPQDLYQTRSLLENALSQDASYARAFTMLGGTFIASWAQPVDKDYNSPPVLERAYQLIRKAVQLDPNSPEAHARLGHALIFRQEHDGSILEFEKANWLNPNYTDPRFAMVLVYAGEHERAISVAMAHMRLDPFFPPFVVMWLGGAYHMLKRYSEAALHLKDAAHRAPNLRGTHIWSAINFAQLGLLDDARIEAAEILRIDPNFRIRGKGYELHTFKNQHDLEHFVDGLRKAGLPE